MHDLEIKPRKNTEFSEDDTIINSDKSENRMVSFTVTVNVDNHFYSKNQFGNSTWQQIHKIQLKTI